MFHVTGFTECTRIYIKDALALACPLDIPTIDETTLFSLRRRP